MYNGDTRLPVMHRNTMLWNVSDSGWQDLRQRGIVIKVSVILTSLKNALICYGLAVQQRCVSKWWSNRLDDKCYSMPARVDTVQNLLSPYRICCHLLESVVSLWRLLSPCGILLSPAGTCCHLPDCSVTFRIWWKLPEYTATSKTCWHLGHTTAAQQNNGTLYIFFLFTAMTLTS